MKLRFVVTHSEQSFFSHGLYAQPCSGLMFWSLHYTVFVMKSFTSDCLYLLKKPSPLLCNGFSLKGVMVKSLYYNNPFWKVTGTVMTAYRRQSLASTNQSASV